MGPRSPGSGSGTPGFAHARPRHNLDSDSKRTWRPYTTDTAADGFVLDGEYRLIIAKALTAADPARPCGCPDIGSAVVAGVEIPGHANARTKAERRERDQPAA
jgi:hypothetical protein